MLKFTLTVDCDNSAFDEDENREVARLLREAATKFEAGRDNGALLDENGNTVGQFGFRVSA